MSSNTAEKLSNLPAFCEGIQYFGEPWADFDSNASSAVIKEDQTGIDTVDDAAAYQTLLGADALRYVTLQVCGSKGSGHPGGFASSAEAHAALMMLGHTNIVTEVGHHAPGFYSSMFLDSSLEDMGIYTMNDMMQRFREKHGLLGHLSGAIPGLLAPAGPLGQGQHFAMAGAYLHRDKLFPVTIGDGGMGEPYVLNAMMHFNTAYPDVTNFLPTLIWNGYSQEHHSMVSLHTNEQMINYWKGHKFEEVILIDAKDFDDSDQEGTYVDSTQFSLKQRLAFTKAVLEGMDKAAKSAMGGTLTAFIIKQLKGAGVHTLGAKSHNLYPTDTLDQPHIIDGLKQRALPEAAWQIVRDNFSRAGGGPAVKTVVTESELDIVSLPKYNMQEFSKDEKAVPATTMGALVAQLGQSDKRFVVTNADGNEASAMKNINDALKIRHPTTDPLYNQEPTGQVYEPLNEDACAGFAAGLALFGSRSLWLSYESFAINGWPIIQTVTQAMAELRRKTPAIVTMFTAGALEQGRNGWTHQRPEIENYFGAMMRNGNVYPLFPCDANAMQATFEYATGSFNKGMVIIASKSPLPVYMSIDEARSAIDEGAATIYESASGDKGTVVFAVTGDMVFLPVFEAKEKLEAEGYKVRIVAVLNPRRLYRPTDIAWDTVSQPDDKFISDENFNQLFDADVLIAVSGGPSAPLEPVLLRTRAAKRDTVCWKRGETTATPTEIMDFNGITPEIMVDRVNTLMS
ncbi:MAG: phosphoketolase [Gammaproteobacteria bacterium]|nr:phosphoketolase [Gammaproteobacteria bacterium]MCW8911561.1 phosphoketolase [Gammaproteobacteria bacterium]MCW9004795.1 phosphoketolase [Gammaproteobacteria bacterium]MCW9055925.1 phosphoketolase [Gammaproteobacteria bacterium]